MFDTRSRKPASCAYVVVCLIALAASGAAWCDEPSPPSREQIQRTVDELPLRLALTTRWPDEPLPSLPEQAQGVGAGTYDTFPPLPANEVQLNTGIAQFGAPDWNVSAFRRDDGTLCILHIEGFRLRALRSVDDGLTFAPEIDVAGLPRSPDVYYYTAKLADDGNLYAALMVADADGGLGLQFVKSADMGLTWSVPRTLVSPEGPAHALSYASPYVFLDMDANAHGRVAIAFVSRADRGARVVSSGDAGDTWTAPVLLYDPTSGLGSSFLLPYVKLAVSPNNGTIHIAGTKNADLLADRRWQDSKPTSILIPSSILLGGIDGMMARIRRGKAGSRSWTSMWIVSIRRRSTFS